MEWAHLAVTLFSPPAQVSCILWGITHICIGFWLTLPATSPSSSMNFCLSKAGGHDTDLHWLVYQSHHHPDQIPLTWKQDSSSSRLHSLDTVTWALHHLWRQALVLLSHISSLTQNSHMHWLGSQAPQPPHSPHTQRPSMLRDGAGSCEAASIMHGATKHLQVSQFSPTSSSTKTAASEVCANPAHGELSISPPLGFKWPQTRWKILFSLLVWCLSVSPPNRTLLTLEA